MDVLRKRVNQAKKHRHKKHKSAVQEENEDDRTDVVQNLVCCWVVVFVILFQVPFLLLSQAEAWK